MLRSCISTLIDQIPIRMQVVFQKITNLLIGQNLGILPNIRAVLGDNPGLWCWPTRMKGDGLRYSISGGSGKWIIFYRDSEEIRASVVLFLIALRIKSPDTTDNEHVWPPHDPYAQEHEEAISITDRLKSSSPWTYGNGQFNPELTPSNRSRRLKHRSNGSRVPPYHASYSQIVEEDIDDSELESESSSIPEQDFSPHIRRGSEGYEVRTIDREEILRRYVASRGDEATRIHSD